MNTRGRVGLAVYTNKTIERSRPTCSVLPWHDVAELVVLTSPGKPRPRHCWPHAANNSARVMINPSVMTAAYTLFAQPIFVSPSERTRGQHSTRARPPSIVSGAQCWRSIQAAQHRLEAPEASVSYETTRRYRKVMLFACISKDREDASKNMQNFCWTRNWYGLVALSP